MINHTNKDVIKIRGHHLVRLADYVREGAIIQSKDYGFLHNIYENRVLKKIVNNPRQEIQIIDSLDSICKYCKKRNESCEKANIDVSYAGLANLKIGGTYHSDTLLNKLKSENFKEFMETRMLYLLSQFKKSPYSLSA